MRIVREGCTLQAIAAWGTESHRFDTEAEADARCRFITEALTWTGTPFRDCADVKGPNGAVDCAMMLTRSVVDTGLIEPFDPRPYSPRWHVHRSEEKFVDWVTEKLHAREVEQPRVGDVMIWRFGRTYSHGAVLVNSQEVLHAYHAAGMVILSRLDEPSLSHIALNALTVRRPVRYFDLWSAAA
jgi:cell wall-associated NlpC family hydrolase